MNVLITGANGQLGRCIMDRIRDKNVPGLNCIYTDVNGNTCDGIMYLDILNENDVESFIVRNNIDFIVNCAAYTNVDKAENDYEMAEALNAFGPFYLAKSARKHNLKCLIHISTDYVFDCIGHVPYNENDMPSPISVYGRTKLMGEELVRNSGCNYLIFRTAWLYSEYGKNFLKTMLRLFNEKDEINVVNDQIGTPTYAGNLAELIVNIMVGVEKGAFNLTPDIENNIYHFTDEGVASWYDLASVIHEYWSMKTIGLDGTCKIKGVTTKEYGSNIKRPSYSVLDKTKLKASFRKIYTPKFWHLGVMNVIDKLLINNN